ncbi:hypothetical protein rosag_25080 [Roseisolibacter agri]|uniref:Outer membrane protein beta-barrel domain-containing protein n=1 Tax=Roseisolibacter agri TaxID=2014610 RepID=A0AA37QGJ4_9BACT|nr:hypothetical protein rosag_25080 [Roseisolibacter agri]
MLAALAALVASPAARTAAAQSWFTPSFQPPQVSTRDFTLGVSANAGTAALFQWREGIDANSHFGLEGGLVDSDGSGGTKLLVGGSYAYQLTRATADQPLALLFTAGAGLAVGDGPDLFRIPVGVSVGHRFALDGGMAITPYVHPRLSLDLVTGVDDDADNTDLSIDFDIGASFEITRQLALRGSLVVSGGRFSDDVGFGLGLTITPQGLRSAGLRTARR